MSKNTLSTFSAPEGKSTVETLEFAVSLMEHLAVATFVLDLDGKVIIWNRACERLTGVMAAEVLGKSEHWRAFYDNPRPTLADLIVQQRTNETDSLYVKQAGDTVVRNGLSAENWCEMPRIDGRHYLTIDSGPIYDNAGKLIAVVETLRDMTTQKEAQVSLELLAMRDGLTGLANRRCFDQTLDAESRRCRREKQSVALLLIDVDNFKRYNDSFGHLAGDECLKLIAQTLATQVQRGGDLAARYGGEEFAIIMPNQTLEGAAIVAERIRAAVEQTNSSESLVSGANYVTVSIGAAISKCTDNGDTASLISAADEAMYQAKTSGRNRVVSQKI